MGSSKTRDEAKDAVIKGQQELVLLKSDLAVHRKLEPEDKTSPEWEIWNKEEQRIIDTIDKTDAMSKYYSGLLRNLASDDTVKDGTAEYYERTKKAAEIKSPGTTKDGTDIYYERAKTAAEKAEADRKARKGQNLTIDNTLAYGGELWRPENWLSDSNLSAEEKKAMQQTGSDEIFKEILDSSESENGGALSKMSQSMDNSNWKALLHSHNLYTKGEIESALYTKTFRFGLINKNALVNTREFLFFTKPDLNIIARDDNGIVNKSKEMIDSLKDIPFWRQLMTNHPGVISMLQDSCPIADSFYNDRFNHLLQNQVISNLDIPGLSSDMIETPSNMYGVSFSYRGSSEASDDNPEFSLEFRDTKNLEIYHFFKAYEEYETLKHHGVIEPFVNYIMTKQLHDQFSIYKFLVDMDMETIIYYGKMYGVFPKSLPREVFSNPNFENGLSYSVDFKAAFYEDMKPDILYDFNQLSKSMYESCPYELSTYDSIMGRADMRLGQSAYIVGEQDKLTGRVIYKLKWKGSDLV